MRTPDMAPGKQTTFCLSPTQLVASAMQLKSGQPTLRPSHIKCQTHPIVCPQFLACMGGNHTSWYSTWLAVDMILKTTGIKFSTPQALVSMWQQAQSHQYCISSQEEMRCAVNDAHAAMFLETCFVLKILCIRVILSAWDVQGSAARAGECGDPGASLPVQARWGGDFHDGSGCCGLASPSHAGLPLPLYILPIVNAQFWMHPIAYCLPRKYVLLCYVLPQCSIHSRACLPHASLPFCHTRSCHSSWTASTVCSCIPLPSRFAFCCPVFCHSCVHIFGCHQLLVSPMLICLMPATVYPPFPMHLIAGLLVHHPCNLSFCALACFYRVSGCLSKSYEV